MCDLYLLVAAAAAEVDEEDAAAAAVAAEVGAAAGAAVSERKKLETMRSTLLAMDATSRAGENSCSNMVFSKGFLGSQLSMSLRGGSQW